MRVGVRCRQEFLSSLGGSLQQISEPRTPNNPRSDYRWWRPLLAWWIFAKQGGKDGYILTKTWHLPSKMAVVRTTAPWSTVYLLYLSQDQRNQDSLLGFSLCAPIIQVFKAHGAIAHPKGPQDSLIRGMGPNSHQGTPHLEEASGRGDHHPPRWASGGSCFSHPQNSQASKACK